MIEIDGLSKRFGTLQAVDGVSLRVGRGEILGLVGPNGAGKTTTLRCVSGIIPPSAGAVRIGGFDLDAQPVEAKRRLAFVPDEPRLFDYLTARDHLRITARLYGVADGAERAERLLDELELGQRKDAFPSELSRGMKQKLMVAMALLHRPEALLLDEPLTGLDPPAMRRMKDRIRFDLHAQPVEAKRRLAFVPDEPRLFDYLTARDHLRITARLYGVAGGAERAERLLDELELGQRKDAFPSELSRGMKQKLMVAMALLHRPEALLLDEPLTGLDPPAMRRMKDRIRETAASGVAVILSSHMLHLVEELCPRVAILVGGRKVLDGTLDEIRGARPAGGRGDLEAIFLKTIGEDGAP